jgi:hypothetical protein
VSFSWRDSLGNERLIQTQCPLLKFTVFIKRYNFTVLDDRS